MKERKLPDKYTAAPKQLITLGFRFQAPIIRSPSFPCIPRWRKCFLWLGTSFGRGFGFMARLESGLVFWCCINSSQATVYSVQVFPFMYICFLTCFLEKKKKTSLSFLPAECAKEEIINSVEAYWYSTTLAYFLLSSR